MHQWQEQLRACAKNIRRTSLSKYYLQVVEDELYDSMEAGCSFDSKVGLFNKLRLLEEECLPGYIHFDKSDERKPLKEEIIFLKGYKKIF